MPSFIKQDLLEGLSNDVQRTIRIAEELTAHSNETLNRSPEEGRWSILQVLAHLNSYNDYYIPAIKTSMKNIVTSGNNTELFKSGVFGNYFTNLMAPGKNGSIANKMKAPKDHTPISQQNKEQVLKSFIEGQTELLSLLDQAKRLDIGKVKVPISISNWIKLKLGDTFRFLIAHQIRHFVQIDNIAVAINLKYGNVMM